MLQNGLVVPGNVPILCSISTRNSTDRVFLYCELSDQQLARVSIRHTEGCVRHTEGCVESSSPAPCASPRRAASGRGQRGEMRVRFVLRGRDARPVCTGRAAGKCASGLYRADARARARRRPAPIPACQRHLALVRHPPPLSYASPPRTPSKK
jgi:hypothetical protein